MKEEFAFLDDNGNIVKESEASKFELKQIDENGNIIKCLIGNIN